MREAKTLARLCARVFAARHSGDKTNYQILIGCFFFSSRIFLKDWPFHLHVFPFTVWNSWHFYPAFLGFSQSGQAFMTKAVKNIVILSETQHCTTDICNSVEFRAVVHSDSFNPLR